MVPPSLMVSRPKPIATREIAQTRMPRCCVNVLMKWLLCYEGWHQNRSLNGVFLVVDMRHEGFAKFAVTLVTTGLEFPEDKDDALAFSSCSNALMRISSAVTRWWKTASWSRRRRHRTAGSTRRRAASGRLPHRWLRRAGLAWAACSIASHRKRVPVA